MYDIAICDDMEMDRADLKEHITALLDKKEDVCFFEYTSGNDLLKAMEDIPFSLIFLDIQMEEMDGEETARQIRKRDHREGGSIAQELCRAALPLYQEKYAG